MLRGSFFGINDNGSLNILVEKKIIEINVGDVFYLKLINIYIFKNGY